MRTLLLCAALALLAGCGKEKPKRELDVTKLAGSAPSPSNPKQGGTFIWGRAGDAVKLDPAAVTDGESVMVLTNIFDTLVSFKPGSTEIVPWLSDRWSISVDQLVWTFHLREGVKFHDGSACDAEAVVFSFQRQMRKDHPARRADDVFAYFQNNFKALEKVESAGEGTAVVFTLSEAYAPFLSALALFSCGIVSPAAWKSEGVDDKGRYKYNFSTKPVGTGPFVFKSWEKDSHIILEANKEHFSGAPPIDRLIFKPIKDNQARLKELEAGGIHGMTSPALEDLESIHADQRLRLLSRPGINVCYLAMNNLKKPFDDIRVRQAVAYAIDKKRIIEAAYDGKASPAVSMCPESMAGHLARRDRRVDLDKARDLLARAGLKDGFDATLMYSANVRAYLPNPGNTAIQIQQDLKQIGIHVKLEKRDWAAYLKATQGGSHQMCILGWMADIFDPDNFLYVLLDKENAVPGQSNNVSFYQSERVHQLLLEAQRSYEWPRRERLYHQVQEIVFEEVPVVPLATVRDYRVLASNVRGYTIYPAGGEYFRHVSFK